MKNQSKSMLVPLAVFVAGLMLVVLFGATGCKSVKGAPSGSLTAVTITNRPMSDVETAIMTVFLTKGYTGGASSGDTYTFTRPGGDREKIAYGSALFKPSLLVKVEVTTVEQSPDTVVVACKAWVIVDQDDAVFEDTHPVRWLGRGPYEDLLEAVKARLGQ